MAIDFFIADENFNGDILRGLLRRAADLSVVRVQDLALSGADDATVLAWAAKHNRILLTHDITTITRYAYERVAAGLRMPGVLVVPVTMPIGRSIEDLLLLTECSFPDEWNDQVQYLPL